MDNKDVVKEFMERQYKRLKEKENFVSIDEI